MTTATAPKATGRLLYFNGFARWLGPPIEYGREYFDHYRSLKGSPIAKRLNAGRVALTEKYCHRGILDVGIGSGEFLDHCRLPAWGFDVNPVAAEWLRELGLFVDPYEPAAWPDIDGLTLWDVLEHLADPLALLDGIPATCSLFVSLPIFATLAKVPASKHYKPGEHLWYFTRPGLLGFMAWVGWRCVESNDDETTAGREGIETFVFQRTSQSPDRGESYGP